MPNNFRLTGNVYVSKEGSDSNSGLTPELPKLTIQAGLNVLTNNQTLIIGSGVYSEPFVSRSTSNNFSVIGDGQVILEGGGNGEFLLTLGPSTQLVDFYNITFRNYRFIRKTENTNDTIPRLTFTNCIVYNSCLFADTGPRLGAAVLLKPFLLVKTILVNVKFSSTEITSSSGTMAGYFYIYDSILINCNHLLQANRAGYGNPYLSSIAAFVNSYADSSTTLLFLNLISPSFFNFNNIQGKIVMYTNGAVSGVNSVGVPLTLAQHKIDYPTFNVNSFSSDPLFNDPQNLNFTLQSSSPHIKAASDFSSNIGGTEYSVYKAASSTEFTTGATISGLTLRGNDSYTITSSPTPGTIETAPIFLQWPAAKPLTKLEWAGSLEFDKSITAGTFGNNNVPDWDTYTTGAGASPDRITVQMRFSTQQTQPTLSSHWDNGGYWTAGNYELFEVNSKPKVDSNGKGNGNPDYIESSALGDLVPTWIQLNIKLIDTYNP